MMNAAPLLSLGWVFVVIIAEGVYIENGPIPYQYEFMPRRPVDQETNNGSVAEFGPSCTQGESETVLCRGRLPDDGQSNGRGVLIRFLHVEQCDPHSMSSLTSDAVRLFSERLVVFKLDCEYDRRSSNSSLELKADALESATALETFTVMAANVRRLPVGFFRSTPRLVRLYLQRNRLTDVSDVTGAFTEDDGSKPPIVNDVLFELGLSGNLIETIADDSFSAFVRLDTLDVSDNRLTSVQPNALRNMNNLRYLNLRGNRLTSLPDTLFVSVAAHLASIDLTDNQLEDDGVFPALDIRFTKMLVLNLGQNRLTSVDGGRSTSLFNADKGRTLLVLRFESNRIQVLPSDGVFRRLSNLTLIDLSNNTISTIGSATFEGLDSLVNLGLSKNNLTHLDVDLLSRCCAKTLMVFDVSDNRLRTLPDLSHLQQLYSLNASGNELVTLNDVHFVDETILNTVDFSRNHISSLRNTTFGFAFKVRELRLDHNRIDRIDSSSFAAEIEVGRQRSTTLQILRLDNNRLGSIDGVFHPPGLLGGLQQLNLSANRLESFRYTDVPFFVRELRIANNLLTSLGEPFKYDLPPHPSLDFLDASGNRITVLAANSVPESIGVLLLGANRIESIDDFALLNKPQLTVLDLSDNRMTSACPSWFVLDPSRSRRVTSGYRTLSRPRLFISGNPLRCTCQLEWLTMVNADVFANTFASVIDLNDAVCSPTALRHNNGRTTLPAEDVSRIVRSTAFLCTSSDRQPCPCIKFGVWPGPSQCSAAMSPQCLPSPCRCFFDASFAKRIVDCSMARLNAPPSNFTVFNATVFYLDGNSIEHLNRTAFDGDLNYGSLSELYLNASHVATIEDATFERTTGLTSLYLQDNRLTSLSAGVFVGLRRLRILYLSDNRLARINDASFSPMIDTLSILGMHSNRITDFAVWKMARSAHQLSYVSLGDNPWSCECEVVEPFRLWLQDYSGVVVDKNNISCLSAAAVPSRVHQLTAFNDSLCRNDTQLMWLEGEWKRAPIAITVSLALVLVVVAALLMYFRHELQVLVYSRYGVRLHWLAHRVNSHQSTTTTMETALTRDDADKMFDAFVSYSSLDEELVVQLVDRLERGFDPPYKLCLHHRNFAGGALITESIIEAVEKSCRTILLLSENFVRSEWCRFEFRAAYLQMLKDRRNRVIVVLVGPFAVDRSRIDREINYYLKTNTYLRWDDRLFWKKLCFALPDRQAETISLEMQRFNFQQNTNAQLEVESSRRPNLLPTQPMLNFRNSLKSKEEMAPPPPPPPAVNLNLQAESTSCDVVLQTDVRNCTSSIVDLVPRALQEFRKMLASKNGDLTDKAAKLQELMSKCESQTDEIVHLQVEKISLNRSLQDEVAERNFVLEKVNMNANLCLELKQRVDEVATKLGTIEDAVSEFTEHNSQELEKLEELVADLRSLSLRHEEFALEFTAKYSDEVRVKEELRDELQAQINNWQEKANGLEKEARRNNDLVVELEQKTAELMQALDVSKVNLKRLEGDISEKSKQIQEIQESKEEVVAELNRVSETQRLDFEHKLQLRDAELNEQIGKHQREMDSVDRDLQAQIEKHTNLLQERDALKLTVDDLNTGLGELQICNQELIEGLADAEEVETALQETKTELSRTLQEQQEKQEELLKLQDEKQHLMESLKETLDEKESFVIQLKSANKDILNKESEISQLKEELLINGTRLSELNEDLKSKNDKLNKNAMDIDDLLKLVDDGESEERDLMKKLNEAERTHAAELSNLTTIVEQKSTEIDELQEKLNSTTIELAERSEIANRVAEDLAKVKKNLSRLDAETMETIRKHDVEKQQMTKNFSFTLEKYKLDGERYANKISGELTEAKSQIKQLSTLFNDKNEEFDRIDLLKKEVDKNLSDALKDKNALERQLRNLNTNYEQLKKDVTEKEIRMRNLTADNERLMRTQIMFESRVSLSPTKTASSKLVVSPVIGGGGGGGGILKRKLDTPSMPSKHVAFHTPSNSETSESDFLEVEFIETSLAKNGKSSSPQMPSVVLRSSKQRQQRIPCYRPKATGDGAAAARDIPMVTSSIRGGIKTTTDTSVIPAKKRLAGRDKGLEWINDPVSEYSLLFDD